MSSLFVINIGSVKTSVIERFYIIGPISIKTTVFVYNLYSFNFSSNLNFNTFSRIKYEYIFTSFIQIGLCTPDFKRDFTIYSNNILYFVRRTVLYFLILWIYIWGKCMWDSVFFEGFKICFILKDKCVSMTSQGLIFPNVFLSASHFLTDENISLKIWENSEDVSERVHVDLVHWSLYF